jgi:hypothetical protein
MTKTLISAAISALLAAPLGALADDNATTWPDKAKPSTQSAQTRDQTERQKARTTPRADQAMSGNSAAAAGSTRPSYDPPVRPNDARRTPWPSQDSAERTPQKPKSE